MLSFHKLPAWAHILMLYLSLDVGHVRNLYERAGFFPSGLSPWPLNSWTALARPLPWPRLSPPPPPDIPLLPPSPVALPGTAFWTSLGTTQKGCDFLPPLTKLIIASGPETRNNNIQNCAWVFKHAPVAVVIVSDGFCKVRNFLSKISSTLRGSLSGAFG